MNEDAVGLSTVGQVLKRRWRLLAVFAVIGAVAGFGASLVLSPGYETSTNVLLQGSREPDELLTEAQLAQSSVVLGRTAAALEWDVSATDLADQVTAAVSQGNIIEITAVAATPEDSQRLADQVAQEYVTYSTQLLNDTATSADQVNQEQQQTLRQQVQETNQTISDLHSSAGAGNTIDSVGVRTELESLRTALSQAMSKLDELDASTSQAKMVVLSAAERPTAAAPPTRVQLIGGGAVAFFLAGLLGHLFTGRADRRLRDQDELASAAGADLLGTVDVPDVPAGSSARGLRAGVARFFTGGRPWHEPDLPPAVDPDAEEIRYRRVATRLREVLSDVAPIPLRRPADNAAPGGPARVLVVTADDDVPARRAVARLTRAATTTRTTLVAVEVSAGRPVVPDGDGRGGTVAGALVVVTAGSRTAWELVAVHGACTDAGHDVLGVVVTNRTRPAAQDRPTETRSEAKPETKADAMAGSA